MFRTATQICLAIAATFQRLSLISPHGLPVVQAIGLRMSLSMVTSYARLRLERVRQLLAGRQTAQKIGMSSRLIGGFAWKRSMPAPPCCYKRAAHRLQYLLNIRLMRLRHGSRIASGKQFHFHPSEARYTSGREYQAIVLLAPQPRLTTIS